MARPGDVVEFKAGLHGIEAPRNLAILLGRRRVKGVPWVRIATAAGPKEIKAEHLTKRTFAARYDGDVADERAAADRLHQILQEHAAGSLAEEGEGDLARLEQALWEATCDDPRPAWTEEEVAAAHYAAAPSRQQLRDVRDALGRCRRAGTGRFQCVAGRGDRWRPWSRQEAEALRQAWAALEALRRRLVAAEETEDGRAFHRIDLAAAGLTDADRATLAWVRDAMAQWVEWDGVPQNGVPVAGIGGLGAAQAFGMDLHRALGFLAQDWIAAGPTSRSSDYVHFLLETGLWTPPDAVAALVRRHVNQEPFFEHVPDAAAEEAAARFPDPGPEPGRTDLRHLACYTIDPADAKDFDDAVGVEARPGGAATLWVHVADVSHYVTPDSTLDRHARKRATSVYLPGRVLPMLPGRLSDHLCSLRDDGDRHALSVALHVDAEGRVEGARFHKALIRVRENLHYGEALARADSGREPFASLLRLAQRMRLHRRGLELETGELKVLLEATGFSALEKRADEATRMVETFMVAANEAVARHLAGEGVPLLYRCHPLPEPDRAERLRHQLRALGFDLDVVLPRKARRTAEAVAETLLDRLKAGGGRLSLFGGAVEAEADGSEAPGPASAAAPPAPEGFLTLTPEEREAWLSPLRRVVDALAAAPDAGLAEVATLKLLGCMGRAFYTPDNLGHFGLASTHYCHFTSPIRRYPDLVVHRNLKWLLAGRPGEAPHGAASLRALCDHCSDQERAADGLERRIQASCLVLASVGEGGPAAARVTGLTPASLFVLRSDGIEARVPVREIPGGPYQVDEWESTLFLPADEARRRPELDAKTVRDWLDPQSGELRLVRARLGDPIQVALAGRDVAAGRTGARVVSWR